MALAWAFVRFGKDESANSRAEFFGSFSFPIDAPNISKNEIEVSG